jgi:hypothetical protein
MRALCALGRSWSDVIPYWVPAQNAWLCHWMDAQALHLTASAPEHLCNRWHLLHPSREPSHRSARFTVNTSSGSRHSCGCASAPLNLIIRILPVWQEHWLGLRALPRLRDLLPPDLVSAGDRAACNVPSVPDRVRQHSYTPPVASCAASVPARTTARQAAPLLHPLH